MICTWRELELKLGLDVSKGVFRRGLARGLQRRQADVDPRQESAHRLGLVVLHTRDAVRGT
jgi:hypothetical protein